MKVSLSQADSGHETLHSDEDSPTPTLERASSEVIYSSISNNSSNVMIGSNGVMNVNSFARSRRSLAEPSTISTASNHIMSASYYGQSATSGRPLSSSNSATPSVSNDGGPIYEDIDQYHQHPPMIAPVSGVPNLKGKSVIRPIAFRPTPGASSGSSTPTNGYVVSSYRPNSANMANMQVPHFDYSGPPHIRASPATSSSHVMMGPGQQPPLPPLPPGHPSCNGEGFPPGHPLVKDGKRHYGSSQELHVQQPAPPAFNKFNSLDRRAITRRHQHLGSGPAPGVPTNSLSLKLLPNSGSESLPVNMSSSYHRMIGINGSHQPSPNHFNNINNNVTTTNFVNNVNSVNANGVNNVSISVNNKPNDVRNMKEPERRHSSYDPASRAAAAGGAPNGPVPPNSSTRYRLSHSNSSASSSSVPGKGSSTAPINISGLPDPFAPNLISSIRGISSGQGQQGNTIYSSQESLTVHHRSSSVGGSTPTSSAVHPAISPRSASATRTSSGTPQFPPTTRPPPTGSTSSSRSVTSITSGTGPAPSPAYASLSSAMHRSVSGQNLSQFENCSSPSQGSSDINQTPSPADSSVSDLETVLKEKETQINFLKETMEQNEQVIFKVYEEKEKMWERELRKLKGLYDNRLRASQQKSSKMEQALTNQTYQLQNERRRLEREIEEMRHQHEQQSQENEKLKQEINALRNKLDEKTNPNDLKNVSDSLDTDVDMVKSNNHNNNNNNITELHVQLKQLRIELERKDSELRDLSQNKDTLQREVSNLKLLLDTGSASSSSGFGHGSSEEEEDEKEIITQKEIIIARDQEIEKLKKDVEILKSSCKRLKDEADVHHETFETERASWLDEKEKVIRYQKQLQLNYVQMYKRNKTLEAEIDTLTKSLGEQEQKNKELIQQHQQLQQQQQSGKNSSGSSKNTATSRLQKTGNSVRARLFKMSLHSESQC